MPRRSFLWPDPRVKPPYGAAEIDWTHPLAQGLTGLWLFNEGAGRPLNLARQIQATVTGATWAPGGMVFSGSGQYLSEPNAAYQLTLNATVVAKVRSTSSATGKGLILCHDYTGSIPLALSIQPVGEDPAGAAFYVPAVGWKHALPVTDVRADNLDHAIGGSYDGTTLRYFVDGRQDNTNVPGAVISLTNTAPLEIGRYANIPYYFQGTIYHVGLYNRALDPGEELQWAVEPYTVLRPIIRRRYFAPAVAVITGASATTLAALTSAAPGTVAVAGTSASTLGALTDVAAGTVAVTGASATTLGTLTETAAGAAALTGASATTLAPLTSTAAGVVPVLGASATTLGALTTAGAGVVGSTPILGTSATTLGDLTLDEGPYALDPLTSAAIGKLLIQGVAARTLGPLTVAGVGIVTSGGGVIGTHTRTLSPLTMVGAGVVTGTPAPVQTPAHHTRTFTRQRGTIPLGPSHRGGNIPLGPGRRRRRP